MLHLIIAPFRLAPFLSAIALCGSLVETAAAGSRHTVVSAFAVYVDVPTVDVGDEDQAPTGGVYSSEQADAGGTHMKVRAFAGLKQVRALVIGSKAGIEIGSGDGNAQAIARDWVTLSTRQAPPNNLLTVNVRVLVDAQIAAHVTCSIGEAYAQAFTNCSLRWGDVGIPNTHEFFGMIDTDGIDEPVPAGTIVVPLTMKNGVPYEITLDAFTSITAGAVANCAADAEVDVYGVFRWLGVESVTDSGGNPITTYTMLDDNGNDWTTPACEADLTGDGAVNIDDFTEVVLYWETAGPRGDVDGDGFVDINDFSQIILGWEGCD